MNSKENHTPKSARERESKLAAALRENLRKRKEQQRAKENENMRKAGKMPPD